MTAMGSCEQMCIPTRVLWVMLALGTLILGMSPLRAAEYSLVVQPILPPEQTKQAFQPLADYLSAQTGEQIQLVTELNFFSYWQTMKKNRKYDLVLDAAHLTDYRVQKFGYTVLAKRADRVSYTLVTSEDNPVLDPEELIGKSVATIGSPSLGVLRLEDMFPNPLRQPVIVEVNDSIESIQKVLDGKVKGAMVPTPLVGQFPRLLSVTTTEQVPHVALSASSRIPEAVRQAIQRSLLTADQTDAGRAMLEAINFPGFDAVPPDTYKGYAALLEGIWGY